MPLKIPESGNKLIDLFALEWGVIITFDIVLVADVANELFTLGDSAFVGLRKCEWHAE